MMGGFTGRPVSCSTGPGQSDAHAGEVAGFPPCLGNKLAAGGHYATQDYLWSVCNLLPQSPFGEDAAAEVGDGNNHVGSTDVDRQDHARGGVEGKARRRPSPAGARLTSGSNQTRTDQRINAGSDSGTGQSSGDCELGPGAGLAVAEKLEEVTSTREIAGLQDGGNSGVVSGGGCHAFSEARLLMRVMQQKFVGNIPTFA
jgi:hypothetical protein